jgi:hypothetical protein
VVTLSGGDKLEAALTELSKKVKRGAKLRVGFFEGATYDDGTSVPLVAAVCEFGQTSIHPNQPPRPFMRRMIAEKSDEWPNAIGDLLVANDWDGYKALNLTGEAIAGQLRQSILDFTSPPLSPITIARKGFDKPLIDSGEMLKAVGHEVEEA